MRKYAKPTIAVLVLVLTVAAFARYIMQHPTALHQLSHVHPATLLVLLALYTVALGFLALAQEGTLDLCRTKLEYSEAFLLVSYTSLVNFFGPLQSGPGFRAVYLKKKYGTKLKNYTLATLLYLGFYAGFSGVFLLSGLVGWGWLIVLAVSVSILAVLGLFLNVPFLRRLRRLHLAGAIKLGVSTAGQVLMLGLIYYTELKSVAPATHFSQALVYTGAANFALFVSLTPGAIGFRESFLLFSQHLHHISSATIVSASLVDRGVYLVFLGLLFAAVLGLHAKQRLLKQAQAD